MRNNNDLVLDPVLLPEWYPQGIYVIPENTGKEKIEETIVKRRYLVLSSETVNGPLLELITGIILACKLSMNDVHVVLYDGKDDYKSLINKYGTSFIMMFGVEPLQLDLPIVFPHFQLQNFSNATWVSSPELGLIQSDKLMKSKLWLCLKQAFSL